MKRREILFVSLIAAVILLPEFGFAADLLEGKIDVEMKNLKDTLFGFPTKVSGMLAICYAGYQSYVTVSTKPLMMWGGVALLSFFMPKIVEALFGV
jgi:hypothetical protein